MGNLTVWGPPRICGPLAEKHWAVVTAPFRGPLRQAAAPQGSAEHRLKSTVLLAEQGWAGLLPGAMLADRHFQVAAHTDGPSPGKDGSCHRYPQCRARTVLLPQTPSPPCRGNLLPVPGVGSAWC